MRSHFKCFVTHIRTYMPHLLLKYVLLINWLNISYKLMANTALRILVYQGTYHTTSYSCPRDFNKPGGWHMSGLKIGCVQMEGFRKSNHIYVCTYTYTKVT